MVTGGGRQQLQDRVLPAVMARRAVALPGRIAVVTVTLPDGGNVRYAPPSADHRHQTSTTSNSPNRTSAAPRPLPRRTGARLRSHPSGLRARRMAV
jgi:hypothetical protein